jgi:hypothetical protein
MTRIIDRIYFGGRVLGVTRGEATGLTKFDAHSQGLHTAFDG